MMVTDVYEILAATVTLGIGRAAVIDMGTVTALCHAIFTKCYGMLCTVK